MAPTYTDARNYVHILTRIREEVSWRRQLLQSDQSDGPREPAPARKQRRLLGDDSALNALCLQVLRLRPSGATWTKVRLDGGAKQEYSERQLGPGFIPGVTPVAPASSRRSTSPLGPPRPSRPPGVGAPDPGTAISRLLQVTSGFLPTARSQAV